MSDTEAQQQSGSLEKPADIKSIPDFVRRWLSSIELASSEEKDWRKYAEEAWNAYESAEAAVTGTAFNIFHANIETICPALYNSTPVPDIRRRFEDRDPPAKAGADIIERVLTYSVDEYDFDGVMLDSISDLSVTGRGVARVTYKGELLNSTSATGAPYEDVGAQSVQCKYIPWSAFRRGPGRTWDEVQWVAFAHYMPREELKVLSPKFGEKVSLDTHISSSGAETKDGAQADNPEADVFKRAMVWEIWDKEKRVVRFIAPGFADDQLAEVPDPLGLKGFFPTPKPMMTGKRTGKLVPLAPYKVYKPLLQEIDTLSKRITRLVKQLRPRALGPANVDLDKLATADDGEIVGVTDVVAFLDSGGLDKMLSWFPMEPVIKAIETLYTQREQAKAALFEVSGLADIMRGQSNPNETKGAQDIKQRWGSLRIQKAQAEIQRFARDLFRLKAEIIAEKFKPENLAMMSGIQLDDQALQVITDQKMRDYRIDIETDSTIRGDVTRNQEAMTAFVAGTAQFFAAIAPAVQEGAVSKTAAISIFSAFARNFKLGKEVDTTLDGLADEAAKQEQQAAQQGPPPNPEMLKVQAQMEGDKAKLQMQGQQMQMDAQSKQQQMQADQQGKQQEAMLKQQIAEREFQMKERLAMMEYALKEKIAWAELDLKKQTTQQDQMLKAQTAHQDNQIKTATAQNDAQIKQKQVAAQAKAKSAA